MTTQTPIHISERFFAKAARYFGDVRSALKELFQNAYRASLPIIHAGLPIIHAGDRPCVQVTLWHDPIEGDTLEIRDFGAGIYDVGAALSIAVSGWDPSVEEEQDPAGMGLCAALAYSERVVIKSRFGTLEVKGDEFFHSSEYRESLLGDIQPDALDTGTSITMIGIKGSTALTHSLGQIIKDIGWYHTAVDIYIRYPSQEDPTPEWTRCQSVRDELTPVCIPGASEDPLTHRGYGLFATGYRHYWMSGTRDVMGVLWHGQRVDVDLSAKALARPIMLPHGEEVVTTPNLPRSVSDYCIVVDHGLSPVTPRLPDRSALILDEKTVDFLWGFLQPLLEHRIQKRYEAYEEFMRSEDSPTARLSGGFLDSDADKLPLELEGALYRHFVKSVRFGLPIAKSSGYHGVVKVLCNAATPRTVLTSVFVLRTSDGELISVESSGSLDDSGVRLTFAQPRRDMKTSGTETIDAHDIPHGIAVSYSPVYGCKAVPREGVMVIDVPFPSDEILEKSGGHCRVRPLIPTDGPIDVEVYHFITSGGESLYSMLDTPSLESSTAYINEVLADAEEVTQHCIPGVVIATNESATDPDEFVWIGDRECLVNTTHAIVGVVSEYEFDEEPEMSRQGVYEAFAQTRRELGGVAELGDAMGKALEQIGAYPYAGFIHRFLIEPDEDGQMWVEVTSRSTAGGEATTRRVRCDLG